MSRPSRKGYRRALADEEKIRYLLDSDIAGFAALPHDTMFPASGIAQRLRALRREILQLDDCTRCKGERGGVRGNENVVDGVVLCDYCHADDLTASVVKR